MNDNMEARLRILLRDVTNAKEASTRTDFKFALEIVQERLCNILEDKPDYGS